MFFREDQLFRFFPVILHENLIAFHKLLRDLSVPGRHPMVVMKKRVSGETVDAILFAIGQDVPEILLRVDVPENRPDKKENRDAHNRDIQDNKPNHVRNRSFPAGAPGFSQIRQMTYHYYSILQVDVKEFYSVFRAGCAKTEKPGAPLRELRAGFLCSRAVECSAVRQFGTYRMTGDQMPWSIMASATLRKPAMLAPRT